MEEAIASKASRVSAGVSRVSAKAHGSAKAIVGKKKPKLSEAALRAAFERFDKDHDRSLSLAEAQNSSLS